MNELLAFVEYIIPIALAFVFVICVASAARKASENNTEEPVGSVAEPVGSVAEPVGSVADITNGYKLDRIYNVLNHIRWIGLSIAMMLALSFIVPLAFS